MFVKICGITNREDAMAAVDAGATALGFIFYNRSPRAVSPEALEDWIAELPPHVWKVGVYVNETPETITRISHRLHLDIAQLHGDETPDLYPSGLRVWKAMRMNGKPVSAEDNPAEAILLDGPGSGQTFDWPLATSTTKSIVLAGGLTPQNVREAIGITKPWGVDTASGVEFAAGRKDHARMKMFIEEALRP
jgi:phosphoribosylanthranilate isomerase